MITMSIQKVPIKTQDRWETSKVVPNNTIIGTNVKKKVLNFEEGVKNVDMNANPSVDTNTNVNTNANENTNKTANVNTNTNTTVNVNTNASTNASASANANAGASTIANASTCADTGAADAITDTNTNINELKKGDDEGDAERVNEDFGTVIPKDW
uniref:Uncharacterized protein n=1 Tax=Lygus hesperus TaxID=30085 RepID=A0A146KZV3_LYGHE